MSAVERGTRRSDAAGAACSNPARRPEMPRSKELPSHRAVDEGKSCFADATSPGNPDMLSNKTKSRFAREPIHPGGGGGGNPSGATAHPQDPHAQSASSPNTLPANNSKKTNTNAATLSTSSSGHETELVGGAKVLPRALGLARADAAAADEDQSTADHRVSQKPEFSTTQPLPAPSFLNSQPQSFVVTKTPFGINRFIILAIITLYVIFVGTHFFNWPPWEKILIEDGAYSWLCDPGELRCAAQVTAVRALLPIATLAMFSFTFLAGLLLDIIGPRTCSLFGVTLLIAGWTLLAFSGPTVNTYLIGFALMAAGSDPAFFGTLSVANLFPGYSSTVISIFGGARSLSNLWPLILQAISQADRRYDFSAMSVTFVGVYILSFFIVLFLVPKNAYPHPQVDDEQLLQQQQSLSSLPPKRQRSSTLTNETPATMAAVEMVDSNNKPIQPHERPLTVTSNSDVLSTPMVVVRGSTTTKSGQPHVSSSTIVADDGTDGERASALCMICATLKVQLSALLYRCKDPNYFLIVLICITNVIRNNFYLTTATSQLGSVETFLGFINVLAFIPGPVCGVLVDKFGPLEVVLGINTSSFLVLMVLLAAEFTGGTAQTVLRYSSVIFMFPLIGFLLSQAYCYIAISFPAKDMGKLAGFACFIAGLFGLVVPPMTRYTELTGTFWPMNILNMFLCFISYGCVGYLFWKSKKQQQLAKQPPLPPPTATTAVREVD